MPTLSIDRPAADLIADLAAGRLSACALAEACLARIAEREPDIRAWAYLDHDLARAQARAADARRAAGKPLGTLHGLPVGVKDIIDTADMPTEYNSPIYRGRRPEKDATLVARLRAAGAIILGKTVTSEFAVYTAGPTRNPHDLSRSPGGSSSGSAAAVAAGMVPLALATQTNGSTIRPASYCGVVGFKPSLGVLPRTGILRQASLLDQPGLIGNDVRGVALLADALAGPDPADEQSLGLPPPRLGAAAGNPREPRLAFVRSPSWSSVDRSARQTIEAFAASLGALATTVDLPSVFDAGVSAQGSIMTAGLADACREIYANSRPLMSDVLAGLVEKGRAIAAMDLMAAIDTRDRLRSAYRQIFADYDAILTPAATGVAPLQADGTGNPIMATLWTLLGAPAITLPLLKGDGGLPLGVQLVGRLGDDAGLISAAAWIEGHAAKQHF